MFGSALKMIICRVSFVTLSACPQPPPMADEVRARVAALDLPPGFAIEVWAEVPGARSLAVTRDGSVVYVGSRDEAIHAVYDRDRDGTADGMVRIGGRFHVPNGIALDDRDRLHVALQGRIVRLGRDGTPEATLLGPGTMTDDFFHGWRYAAFGPDGHLYVAVGAPCNICEVSGVEGTIIRLPAEGGEPEIYARGIRNSVGLDWHPETGELFFTDNGADYLGDTIPPDELNRAPEAGWHFGYPYVWGDDQPYPDFTGDGYRAQPAPEPTVLPAAALDAHGAALGIDFYEGALFPEEYRGDAFIAQHGSWNRADPVGYRVLRVRFDDRGNPTGQEPFVWGWLQADGSFWGRPVDIEELPDGSLLVSDDYAGVIYRISYQAVNTARAGG